MNPVDSISHSDVDLLQESSMGMNIDPPLPLPLADEEPASTSGTQAPPHVQCTYHQQMNGK